jgi:hypothetical protein
MAHQVMPGTWVTHGEHLHLSPTDALFWIAEDEGPGDRLGILQNLAETMGRGPDIPKAIIGNGWHDAGSLQQMLPVVAAGFSFITECYARTDNGDPTGYTPSGLEANAVQALGFPGSKVEPCFGIFGGARPADYTQWKAANPGWSDYTVENVLTNA